MQNTVPFEDCPVGMFLSASGELCVKTEYGLDAYIVSTGEKFWGGAKSLEQLRQVLVRPVEVEPVRHAHWTVRGGVPWCSSCGEMLNGFSYDNDISATPRCSFCGAVMYSKEE